MEEDYLKKLVKRYLDKKATDNELEIFVYLMKQGKLDRYLQEAMDDDIRTLHNEPKPFKKNISLRWPIAAAITCIICLFGYMSLHLRKTEALVKLNTIHNRNQRVYKQILPDGTAVWLNPNASLSYPSRFGKFREVSMQGEVFFEVTKDHLHPFLITSGNVLTKVWGTSFRIRSIPGENNTKVSVLTGKVSVSIPVKSKLKTSKATNEEEVMLLPEEEVTYQHADHHLVKAPIPAASDMIIWHKAKLSFENTKLETIAVELSKYYHIKVLVEGEKLNQYQLTADFTDKNLADILFLISKSVHTDYVRNDNKIILRTIN